MTISEFAIPDMHAIDLAFDEGRLVVLKDTDHLLRRFGQLSFVQIAPGAPPLFSCRQVADEIYALISGQGTYYLADLRPNSPSFEKTVSIALSSDHPKSVLVPFGVAVAFEAVKNSQVLVLSTHVDGDHPEDRKISFSDLAKFFSVQ